MKKTTQKIVWLFTPTPEKNKFYITTELFNKFRNRKKYYRCNFLVWGFMILLIALGGVFLFLPKIIFGENFYADSDVPMILPRSTWDNTPSLNTLMTWLPQNTDYPSDWQPVERIILHDTGCDTSNSSCNNNQDPIATIQGIYRYHAVTRDWGDIGYNYLIDQQGRIYEGRYGGNGSRGAHTYFDRAKDNFNFGSIGIAVLGNYAMTQPPAVVYESLARLVGWLAADNNLDPSGKSESFIWNTVKGGFKSYHTGSVIVSHKDVEPGNPDPGLIDLVKIRREAAALTIKFKNYIYQASTGAAKIYKLVSGARQVFAGLPDYTAQGGTYGQLISLSLTQLDIFSESRFFKYPDGALVQIISEPNVYLIDGQKCRPFEMTAVKFKKMGFDFKNVKQVTADELNNYPLAAPIKYGPDGSLLSDGGKVYLIQNGKKRWIVSSTLFSISGYRWSKVKNAPAELQDYLEDSILTYPDGTLVRAAGQATVYLIQAGQKRQFLSSQSFLKLGYRWDKVISTDEGELTYYPTGYFVSYADSTLVKAENNPSIFLVDQGKIRPFLSAEIFQNLKYKPSQAMTISSQELAYYPVGEPVKYKDGTLLRPKTSPNVYLIVGGRPQPVDAATFKKKKYKWSNVLVIADKDFNDLYVAKPASVASAAPVPPLLSGGTGAPTTATTTAPILTVPKIRIALFEVITPKVEFSANSTYDILDKNGQVMATKKAQEIFSFAVASSTDVFVKIAPQAADGVVEVLSYEDHPAWKLSLNYNKFRGSVEIIYSAKSGGIWAVNELLLEDYLKGVAETIQGDPKEYQKTMAVAARTYAYYYLLKGGKHGADEVYHLTKTTGDQLYKGYNREILASSVVEAVEATRGEIATFGGQPIVAAYSSGAPELMSSGTKSACAVWGNTFCQAGFEYLAGGVKDPAGAIYNYSICSGANHCVGLSGAGTRQFAKTGAKNYQEILKYYYPGTSVQKIY